MINFARVGIKILIVIVALGFGVLLGWLIFRIREEKCLENTFRCETITYQIDDNDNLLVTTPNGMIFLYDGTYILSYTEEAPGSCQTAVSDPPSSITDTVPIPNTKNYDKGTFCTKTDATGKCVQYNQGDCLEYDPSQAGTDKFCKKWNDGSHQPSVLKGTKVGMPEDFQSVFAIDAKTMKLINGQTLCAKRVKYVLKDFENVKKQTVTHRLGGDYGYVLNVYEIFEFLEKAGIFVRPS